MIQNKSAPGSTPQIPYRIYKIKNPENNLELLYAGYERAVSLGLKIDMQHYDLAHEDIFYSASKIPVEDVLDSIFYAFNCDMPGEFTEYGLGLSDVIALRFEGENRIFYCDYIEFREIDGFFPENEDEK